MNVIAARVKSLASVKQSLMIGSGLSQPLYKTQAAPVSSRTTEKSSQTGR